MLHWCFCSETPTVVYKKTASSPYMKDQPAFKHVSPTLRSHNELSALLSAVLTTQSRDCPQLHKRLLRWVNFPLCILSLEKKANLFIGAQGVGKRKKKTERNYDLLHVQSAEKRIVHHPEKRGGLFLQEKRLWASQNKPRIYHQPIISSVWQADQSYSWVLQRRRPFVVCLLGLLVHQKTGNGLGAPRFS